MKKDIFHHGTRMPFQNVCQLNARRYMRSSANLHLVFLLTAVLLMLSACGQAEIVSPSAKVRIVQPGSHQPISLVPRCSHIGTVQQIGNVLGCNFLIIMPDGNILQPLIVDEPNFQFVDGQKVRFDYQFTTPGITCAVGTAIWVKCISVADEGQFQDVSMH